MNLLTADVTKSMIGASSYMKMSDVSINIYKQAENKGDTETMMRSLGYADASMNTAEKFNEESQEALKSAQEKAAKQTKKQQQADIEKKSAEAAQARKDKREADMGTKATNSQGPDKNHSADTIQISNEGKIASQGSVQSETVDNTVPQTDVDISYPAGDALPTDPKLYTPSGSILPEVSKSTLCVLA